MCVCVSFSLYTLLPSGLHLHACFSVSILLSCFHSCHTTFPPSPVHYLPSSFICLSCAGARPQGDQSPQGALVREALPHRFGNTKNPSISLSGFRLSSVFLLSTLQFFFPRDCIPRTQYLLSFPLVTDFPPHTFPFLSLFHFPTHTLHVHTHSRLVCRDTGSV